MVVKEKFNSTRNKSLVDFNIEDPLSEEEKEKLKNEKLQSIQEKDRETV